MAVSLGDLHALFLFSSPVPLPSGLGMSDLSAGLWAFPSGLFFFLTSFSFFLLPPPIPFLLETWSHFVALAVL